MRINRWPRLQKTWVQLDAFCNRHELLMVFLAAVLILRLPNFAEPYWYGDEAIYLTIGTAMRHGLRLYVETIDHKTPLIYYLAMVPGQLGFRLLALLWSLASVSLFWSLARRMLSLTGAMVSTGVFVLFTCLPALEGNIPNGELFVLGFILFSAWLLWHTTLGGTPLQPIPLARWSRRDTLLTFLAGCMGSLGILTKVPGILDVGALGAVLVLSAVAQTRRTPLPKRVRWLAARAAIFTFGVITPLALSLVYYWFRGSLAGYLEYGLLYNFRYAQDWTVPFTSPIARLLVTLPAKAAVVVGVFLIALWRSWNKPAHRLPAWVALWLVAALFAALLSNRPYPHYWLQLAAPVAFGIGWLIQKQTPWIERSLIIGGCALMILTLVGFGVRPYATVSYYRSYMNVARGKLPVAQYHESFNALVPQNALLTARIVMTTAPTDRIFIWGTNPMLYAETRRSPATPFTVSFHIHGLRRYEQTLIDIRATKPEAIVVMRQEPELPGLNEYLRESYQLVMGTADMLLFERRPENLLQ